MIRRRVIAHFRKQEWTAIAIDFVIVVVGVSVGIQVSNWNAARQDAARQRVYVERLQVDFEGIRARLNEHLKVFAAAVEGGDYLKSVIAADEAQLAEIATDEDRMEKAFDALASNRIPPPPPATYSEMVSEGQLSGMRDPVLRDRLADYDRLLGVVLEVSRNNTDSNTQLLPVLFRHFNSTTLVDDSVLSGIREEIDGYDLAGMRSDREFAVAVVLMRRNALNSLQQRRIQLRQIDEILTLLRAEPAR
jgi:hypothetical protein